ncbi:hypothetical protein PR003_g9947 [Phytophthora rubi]|uniref:Uncharacterized protein n=1 Tax=Phytophthora rubi TaxID=129364 RepID=A0A6A3MI02_9STRA|nr:hypothetical protein PR002_g9719 [Phytophthora rubi]KAE9035294.1 hypothetical protein PR001_g9374 [Phytophthora rubi]KAE9341530.1 hypothetical protein PR003_g9947 [Phytophthora rubi]
MLNSPPTSFKFSVFCEFAIVFSTASAIVSPAIDVSCMSSSVYISLQSRASHKEKL